MENLITSHKEPVLQSTDPSKPQQLLLIILMFCAYQNVRSNTHRMARHNAVQLVASVAQDPLSTHDPAHDSSLEHLWCSFRCCGDKGECYTAF